MNRSSVQLRNDGGSDHRRHPCLPRELVFSAREEAVVASRGSDSVGPGLGIPVEVLLSWGNKFSFDRAELLDGKKVLCRCVIKPS